MTVLTATPVRSAALDRLRGLAILLMIGDHLAIVVGGPSLFRFTLGRLAVPLFFLVSGHLFHGLSWRHLVALDVGVGLSLWVPFTGSPNVLVWWALGCIVLAVFRRHSWPVWPLVVLSLTFASNGWTQPIAASADPWALLALLALGSMLDRGVFAAGERLPGWVGRLGACPMRWYVGHVLALQLVIVALGLSRV